MDERLGVNGYGMTQLLWVSTVSIGLRYHLMDIFIPFSLVFLTQKNYLSYSFRLSL